MIARYRHPNALGHGQRQARCPGGNQQKVIVAREFEGDLKLLILDQPTRGLDVGSIEFIHRQAIARRDAGIGILLVSAELDEILELSDRIGVMYRGAIVDVLDGRTADRETVGLLMATGGRTAEPEEAGLVTGARGAVPGQDPIGRPRPVPGHRPGAPHRARVIMILSSPLVNGSLDLLLPITAYVALFEGAFGSVDAWIKTLVNATPLILVGFAVGIGFKAGLFNIGGYGQFLVGALAATAVAIALNDASPVVAIPLSLLAGMGGGCCTG